MTHLDLHRTPCQRGCCWTPHGVCATKHQCAHHKADHQRAINDATAPLSAGRLIFSSIDKHETQVLTTKDQILLHSVLRPNFSHQEQH